MRHDIFGSLKRLADQELVSRMKALIAREREATAEIVAHLAELDTREFHLREGYPSLFVYCRDVLGLSEWEAYNRIEVARSARRFPMILDLLADGSVHLTAVRLLAPHLTPENHHHVLESARGRTKAEVEQIVARLAPQPDAPFSMRKVSAPLHGRPAAAPQAPSPQPLAAGHLQAAPTGAPVASLPPAPGACATPLSSDRYKLQVTIDGETLEMFHLAKDMLGHAIPEGDPAAILNRAFKALLTDLGRKRFAETSRPRAPRTGKASGRTPSAAVKRAVWVRDLGRCAFVGGSGHRCNERRFVEFHHVDPYALGGEATLDGIQLRCRRHNDYEGRLYFGTGRRRRQLVPEQVGLSVPGSIRTREIT
jgi:hypothetical protein